MKQTIGIWICVVAMFFCSSISTGADSKATLLSAEPSKTAVLQAMETAADWQLNHPAPYLASWKTAAGKQVILHMLSDGAVMKKEERDAGREERPAGIPLPWVELAGTMSGTLHLRSLPPDVQKTIARESKGAKGDVLASFDYKIDGWEMSTLYAGMAALAEASSKTVYTEALRRLGASLNWKLSDRLYHADDHCIGQMYLALYEKSRDPRILADVQERFDWILKHPPQQDLAFGNLRDRWNWCDALFMAPPVWTKLAAVTGDRRYLYYMDNEWWATTDHIYDKDEHLYYRDDRFIERREPNGRRVFWSRGNGWVIAGLVRVLDSLPEDYYSRQKYVKLYKELAERIASLQPEDGLWRPSMLDPASFPFPETSGSGFFCYGIAWGIRKGILERGTFLPVVEKAWAGLIRSVRSDGMLGWVQLPGSAPDPTNANTTAPYGVGAFLLAGSELLKLAQ